jgi:hypothetical protein
MNPLLFLCLILISRSTRFITECAAIKFLGERVKTWPKQYFKFASIAIVGVILIALVVISLTR